MFTRSTKQFSYKVKDNLRYISRVITFTRRSFRLHELHFEQNERVVNFKRQISTYICGNSLESASETQFLLTKPVNYHDEVQKLFSNQENVINTEFKTNFQNPSPKVKSQSISSDSSHSSNSSNGRSSRVQLAELEIKRQQAEILICQKKEKYERKIKLLERQKEELVEAQNIVKLAEIKKNKIAGRSNSLSDNNINDREDILENDVVSKKHKPVQSYDRSFCKDKFDNRKSNERFRDEAKSEK